MTIDEHYQLIVLQYLKDKDTWVLPDKIISDLNNDISAQDMNKILSDFRAHELTETHQDTSGQVRINRAGLYKLSQLISESDYDTKVKQVPQSVMDTNNALQTVSASQVESNKGYWKWAVPTLLVAIAALGISYLQYLNDKSERNLLQQQVNKDSLILQIQMRQLQQESLTDSLRGREQFWKEKSDSLSKMIQALPKPPTAPK